MSASPGALPALRTNAAAASAREPKPASAVKRVGDRVMEIMTDDTAASEDTGGFGAGAVSGAGGAGPVTVAVEAKADPTASSSSAAAPAGLVATSRAKLDTAQRAATSMFTDTMTRVEKVVGGPATGIGTGKRRRRACRVCSCVCIMGVSFLIYLIAILAASVIQTVPYDPNNELALQIRGCDVDIKPGTSFEITIRRWLGKKSRHTVTWNTAGTHVVNAVVDNEDGCDALFFECRQACSVTITTDANSATVPTFIKIDQRSDDTADHVAINILPGTHLNGFRADGPTVQVMVDNAVIDGGLAVRGVGAPVIVRDTLFGSADLRATKSTVNLIDTRNHSRDFALSYRIPSAQFCVATRSNGGSVIPGPAWSTNPAPWSRCALDHSFWGRMAVKHYDTDNDFMVTINEFSAGLTKLPKCCGALCPFVSLCAGLEVQVFPTSSSSGDNTLSGRSGIVTDSEFLARLKALNDTTLVPNCLAEGVIQEPTATSRVPLKIIADDARVETTTEAWASPSRPDNSQEGNTLNTTFWTPPGRVDGLKLLKRDADRLMAEVRDVYGRTDQTGDVFVIIDVAESAGVPSGRWIYTTRPIFLNLDPAILQLISFGLLTPPIMQYRVHLVNADCHENGTRYGADGRLLDVEARKAAIFEQLKTALTPRFQLETRGVIVQIDDDHRPPPQTRAMTYYDTDLATGEVRAVDFGTQNDVWAVVAVYLSIGIGCVLALLGSVVFIMYTRSALQKKRKADAIKQRILDLQIEARSGVKVKRTKSEEDKLNENSMNPLEQPLELIELLVITPIRRTVVNSITKFVDERCKVVEKVSKQELMRKKGLPVPDDTGVTGGHPGSRIQPVPVGGADKGEPELTMDEFVEAYSRFCYKFDLKEVQERKLIKQMLIMKYDARVKGNLVERLRGVRWKREYASDEARKALAAELLAQASRAQDIVQQMQQSGETPQQDAPTDDDFLQQFASKYCDVTEDIPNDFVEFDDVNSTPGFRALFEVYVEAQGWEAPDQHPADMYERVLRCKFIRRRVLKISGIQFLDFSGGERAKLGCKWYGMELLTVFIDLLFLFLLPIIIIDVAMKMQYMYAFTTAPTPAVTFFDVMDEFPPNFHDKHVMLMAEIIVYTMFAFMGIATLRLFLYYLDISLRLVKLIIRRTFAVLLTLFVFVAFAYIGVVCMWFLLAAVLNPTKYLPYGAAVATIGVAVYATWSSMLKAARVLRERMKTTFRSHMQKTMRKARAMLLQQERLERKLAAGGALRRRTTKTESGTTEKVVEEDFDVADVFSILNQDDDGVLTEAEFNDLFKKLQINVPQRKREQIFAFCDADGSGTISQEEFVDSWDWVEQQMVLEAAEEAGLDDSAIIVAVVTLVILMLCVFSFIFVAIRAWNNEGSFDAVIQSFLVVASGKVTTLAKSKPKSPEELDELVNDVVEGQDEVAAEPLPGP